MATTARKAAPRKSKATQAKSGAGYAVSARSKDSKKTFGKAAPKRVKPMTTTSAATKPAKRAAASKSSTEKKPSVARRVVRKVASKATGAVSGAVALAASVVGGRSKSTKAKGK